MFTQVELQYDNKPNALLVPKRAVMAMDNSASVFVVGADNTVERKVVKIGYESDEYMEIIEGLNEGDQVVTAGQAGLKDKTTVNVVKTNS